MNIQDDHHDIYYRALLARDTGFENRVWVGVTSTGIFCRLSCPARKPKPENCQFYHSIPACIQAGFRPCLRCKPLGHNTPDLARALMAQLDQDPERRWSEQMLVDLGHDPSTVRRVFQREFGMTFLEMARQRRLSSGAKTLAAGGKVIEAQLDAGFDSPGAFRKAFARYLGMVPSAFADQPLLFADWIDTPLGAMIAVTDRKALHLLEFTSRKALPGELRKLWQTSKGGLGFGRTPATEQIEQELHAYFAADSSRFDVPLHMDATDFTQQVWRALRDIPAGETRSYSDIARAIGRPQAVRAVARANGANPIAIVIPCHRVIGMDGALTGYGGGLWRKQRLLDIEHLLKTKSAPA